MTTPPTLPDQIPLRRSYLDTLITAIAALLNIVVLVVNVFLLMPRVDVSIAESEKNRQSIELNRESVDKNREFLQAVGKELETHTRVLRRLSDLLDQVEKRAREIEDKKKKSTKP